MYPKYATAADLLPAWKAGLRAGVKPTTYPVGDGGFARVRVGPGLLLLIGGPPGLGKTALAMQWALDALRASPDLRALIVNVETGPTVLLDRQLSRVSGIDYSLIRDREPLDGDRLEFGFGQLDAVADRLAFIEGPYTLEHVAAVADVFRPTLIVADYLQRIPPTETASGEIRQQVSASMQYLRRFTDAGLAIIALSAVNRGKEGDYSKPGLGSFRESSEAEFGADDAYLLAPAGKDAGPGALTLHHVKARHGERIDMALTFDGAHQSFTATDLDDVAAGLAGVDLDALFAGGDA